MTVLSSPPFVEEGFDAHICDWIALCKPLKPCPRLSFPTDNYNYFLSTAAITSAAVICVTIVAAGVCIVLSVCPAQF